MFGHGYFGAGYFGPGYFGPGTGAPPSPVSAQYRYRRRVPVVSTRVRRPDDEVVALALLMEPDLAEIGELVLMGTSHDG